MTIYPAIGHAGAFSFGWKIAILACVFFNGGHGEPTAETYISKQVALWVQAEGGFKPTHEMANRQEPVVATDDPVTSLPNYVVTGDNSNYNRKLNLPELEKKSTLDLASDFSVLNSRFRKFSLKGGLLKNEGPSGVSLTCAKWSLLKIEW